MRASRGTLTFVLSQLLALPGWAAAPPRVEPAPTAFDLRVSKIDADVTLDPEKASMSETVSLIVQGKGLSRLDFAIDEGLVVTRTTASVGAVEYRQAGSELSVELVPPLDGSRTLTFALKGRPHAPSEIGPRRVVLAPSAAWYPLAAGMWADAAVIVRLPQGWTAVAPGRTDARTASGVFRWTTDKPVRSIAIAAAPGLRLAEAKLVETPFHLCSATPDPSLKAASERLSPAMSWLSGSLGPYPFDGFQLVLLPGYTGRVQGSGILIAGADVPLASASDGADVLAGQWFGELLAGDGPWMQAFAAWEGCVFAQDRTLPIPADVAAQRDAYFQLRSGDVALSKATAATPLAVLRGKGSAVPEMIRLVAGNRATFDAVRALFAAPVGPPISLAAVRAMIEKHAERPLERVFTDWFDRAGAPEIGATLKSYPAATGGFRADVAFVQSRGAYALPVEIVIYGEGAEHRETVEIDGEATSVFYVLPFEPKRLEIDPLNRIFRRK